MDKKILTLLAIVAIILVAGGTYLFLNSCPHYKNITLNGITMEVPESDINVTQQTDIYSFYNDTENHVDVFVLDSTQFGLNDLTEALTFATLREMFQAGATQQSSDGYDYNYSDTTKVYSYVGNYSHKNILIVTGSRDDMIHILQSINVDMELSLNDTNQTNETTSAKTSQSTATKKNDVVEEDTQREDEKVIDGWDPKKHEVSREKLDDDFERVTYDDGYFRVVDKKGNVESYGY